MIGNRFVSIQSSLGADALLFESMDAQEGLSTLFCFVVKVLSEDPDLDLGKLLGEPMTIQVILPDDSVREFSGIVGSVSWDGGVNRYTRYVIVLYPWLWMLQHRQDCRIRQHLTAVEIIKEVFSENGYSDIEDALTQSYGTREYSVQYCESDFSYVSRLMEEEGIYYFFKHEGGRHVLVLCDGVAAHSTFPGYAEVPFYPPGEQRRERDHLEQWRATKRVASATYAMTDYDFERPQAELLARRLANTSHQAFEQFSYPGGYKQAEHGEQLAQVRLEELQGEQEVATGAGPVGGLACGALFTLTGFPRSDQNCEYLVVSSIHSIAEASYEPGGTRAAELQCGVRVLNSRIAYRPPRSTRRPIVEGPQTALVVGMSGEDIWTDEHGRVKVQFHWDRYGTKDENSSCWVRVAQIWAGTGFGGQFLPRIGQEVIVEFLEGDPDRPLITGRVYNGDNQWPYELPGNQTQSGIKTRSSLGGVATNFNEIRFEDKKGEEELHLQAEKDMTTLVKNDQSTNVTASRSASVGGGDSVSVGGDRSVSVTGKLAVTVKGGESKQDVTGKYILNASDTIDLQAPNKITLTCGGSTITMTPDKIVIAAGGGSQVALDADGLFQSSQGSTVFLDANALAKSSGDSAILLDANAHMQASGGGNVLLDADVNIQSNAGDQLLLDGSARLNSPGDVSIEGATVTCSGETEASLACGGQAATMSKASADLAGALVNVSGQSAVSIAGSLIKIG